MLTIQEEKQENEDTKDTGQVILEKATKLKDEIKNIIDDVISNSDNDEWIINLNNVFKGDEYEKTIKKLNEISTGLINNKENKKKKLQDIVNEAGEAEITGILTELLEKIKSKFDDLGYIIKTKIENQLQILGISNFEFDLVQSSIEPELTSLSWTQVVESLKKLLKKPATVNYLESSNSAIINKIDNIQDESDVKNWLENMKIELFKVTTNLSYTLSIENKEFSGEFNNCELLLTSNDIEYKKVKKITQKTIENLITNDESSKTIEIISDDSVMQDRYTTIFKQYNWDFSHPNVKNDIKTLQLENIKSSKNVDELKNDLEFKPEYVNFEPLNYMKFTNKDLSRKQNSDDCILYCISGGLQKTEGIKNRIYKQFGNNEQGISETGWDGGKINNKFIEQLKKLEKVKIK